MFNLIGSPETIADFVGQFEIVSGSLGLVAESTKTLAALLDADSRPAGQRLVAALEAFGAEWAVLVEYLPMMFDRNNE